MVLMTFPPYGKGCSPLMTRNSRTERKAESRSGASSVRLPNKQRIDGDEIKQIAIWVISCLARDLFLHTREISSTHSGMCCGSPSTDSSRRLLFYAFQTDRFELSRDGSNEKGNTLTLVRHWE